MGPRLGVWRALATAAFALMALPAAWAGEQVLLLSEPGSGAHAFASLLAAEAKAKRGDDFHVAWDPCAVARRRRAAQAIGLNGSAAAALAFKASQCSDLVQVLDAWLAVIAQLRWQHVDSPEAPCPSQTRCRHASTPRTRGTLPEPNTFSTGPF